MGTYVWFVGCFTLFAACSGHLLKKDSVTPLIDYAVRLADGPGITEGRLELSINGQWGSVCDAGFSDVDAQVACVSLGFDEGQGTFLGNTYGPGTGAIYFTDVDCTGTESHIDDCPHAPLGATGNCTNDNDVSISCVGTGYPVRLADSASGVDGRLEINFQGVWGTVCDDFFNVNDARVACFSLGLDRVGYSIANSFGEGTGAILLDDVECVGDEANIGYCVHDPWGTNNCLHSEDVAISCSSIDAATRLTDGPSANEGRLELYFNGQWGTVCGTGFTDVEAQVACNNLGFEAGQGAFLGNTYGPGLGQVLLDDVVCTGTEEILADCEHSPVGSSECTHDQDVSISCVGTESYDVRLVGGSQPYEGRVEILYRGVWGTVCDDGFNANDARVVCNSLGYGFTGYSVGNDFGVGTGQIWLDDVTCEGTESNIGHCVHPPWGINNCLHSEDVSVTCSALDVAVRLIDGATATEGRIEANVDGEWGTICDNGFGQEEAEVACLSLGFDAGQGTFLGNEFGAGSGRILLDQVVCAGSEFSLNECDHAPIGVTDCTHSDDVSISCVGTGYPVRLSDGIFATDGRVEIFYRGEWGTVCDDAFTDVEAQVACYSLGYGRGAGRFTGNLEGSGKIWIDDLSCGGFETNIGNCGHQAWGQSNCEHDADAAITCSSSTGTMYPVRLIGSDGLHAQNSGRLEYYRVGSWGTVCDPGFTDADAQVACYSLGFTQFEGTYIGQAHGSASGQLWLDNVGCTGDEVMLDDCPHGIWGTTTCDHSTDVSIQCTGPWPANPVRLINPDLNSTNPTIGRLEISYYGSWGTVCDDAFTPSDANVVCASLGFGYVGTSITNTFGQATGRIWLDEVNCVGNELSIANCNHQPWGEHNCVHFEDVAIDCEG